MRLTIVVILSIVMLFYMEREGTALLELMVSFDKGGICDHAIMRKGVDGVFFNAKLIICICDINLT